MEGDHAGFVACFAESVRVYGEPELSPEPLISSRAQLRSWLEQLDGPVPNVAVTLKNSEEHGASLVTDAIIVGAGRLPEAWRLVLAVRTSDGMITQVRVFRDRAAAWEWVTVSA
jgi:ketosteroid isomerase-like protein